MQGGAYRYTFEDDTDFYEVMATVDLARLAIEGIHGEAKARMDARSVEFPERREVVIDAGTAVGEELNRVFVGLARREFGDGAFEVERLERMVGPEAAAA